VREAYEEVDKGKGGRKLNKGRVEYVCDICQCNERESAVQDAAYSGSLDGARYCDYHIQSDRLNPRYISKPVVLQ
jgi:hypothetical protein